MKNDKKSTKPLIQPKHYEYKELKFDGTQCDLENLKRIQSHVAKHIAPVDWVWAEI